MRPTTCNGSQTAQRNATRAGGTHGSSLPPPVTVTSWCTAEEGRDDAPILTVTVVDLSANFSSYDLVVFFPPFPTALYIWTQLIGNVLLIGFKDINSVQK